MKIQIALSLALIPVAAAGQTSKPAKPKSKEARAEAELLAKAREKLQALAAYDAYHIAHRVLLNKPNHALATRLRDAARIIGVQLDGRIVSVAGKRAVVSLGSDDRAEKGLVLTLYRRNTPLAHARVVKVDRDSSVVELFERKAAVLPGDSATSSWTTWHWVRDGYLDVSPRIRPTQPYRKAMKALRRRCLYDVYMAAREAPDNPLMKKFQDAARLAQKIVTGELTAVGKQVRLNVGRDEGLHKGALLTVTRKGKLVGTVRVTKVEAKTAVARASSGQLEQGDRASTDPALWPK